MCLIVPVPWPPVPDVSAPIFPANSLGAGVSGWRESIFGVIEHSFAHHPLTWPIDLQSAESHSFLEWLAFVIVPGILIALAVLWAITWRSLGQSHLERRRACSVAPTMLFPSAQAL